MKKIISFLFTIIMTSSYAQHGMEKVIVPVKQTSGIHSSDYLVFEHALELKNPDSFLYSGFKKIQKQDFEGAIEDLSRSLDNSKVAQEYTYFYRGVAKYLLGDYKYAEIDFTKSLLINSRMADSYFLRALCKFELGEFDRACIDFNKTTQPGKALYSLSSSKVFEAISTLCSQIPIDSTMIDGLAKYD